MSRIGRRTQQPGSAVVGRWLAPSLIQSIQRGTIAITGATSATATVAAVQPEHCRLVWLGDTYSDATGSGNTAFVRLALTTSTTVTGTTQTSPGAATVTVAFELIEYRPGVLKSVQRGTISQPATTATITEVDPAKAQVEYLGQTCVSGGAAIVSTQQAKAVLTNGTTVTVTAGVNDGQVTGYQVTEWF